MAVPKRKTGRARTHSRRSSNDRIDAPSRSVCPQCGEVKSSRTACARTAASTRTAKSSRPTSRRAARFFSICALTSLPAHRARRATRREAFW